MVLAASLFGLVPAVAQRKEPPRPLPAEIVTAWEKVARLKSLQYLDLRDTQITDAGLKELSGLKSLRWLQIDEGVKDAGVGELKKALPGLKVVR